MLFTGGKKRFFLFCVGLLLFFFWITSIELLYAGSIRFRIVAVNPSKIRSQRVPIKVYLPQEVTPKDVLDLGGLKLEFDPTRSLFYVYKDDIILRPAETRVFEVEIKDIWVIPPEELDVVLEQAKSLALEFKGSEYEPKAEELYQKVSKLADEIIRTQSDEMMSRSQHIGIYRKNLERLDKVKKDLADMEKLLKLAKAPLTPEMLKKGKFTTEAPSKTATWVLIFVIMIFLALLSLVFFFTWHRQARIAHKRISQAKEETFSDEGK